MRSAASAIQGTSSASVFHHSARAPPGAQDAQGFRDGAGGVGPVPGLGVREEVPTAVGEGEVVARAADERDARVGAAELGGHARPGFHGDDVRAPRVQEGGGDPGAGADVRDAGAGEGAAGEGFDRVEEGRGVGGSVGRVLGRGGVEGVGAGRVQRRGGTVVGGRFGFGGVVGMRSGHAAMVAGSRAGKR